MFMGALFTIAKRCKKPKYALADEWINNTRSLRFTGVLFSLYKEGNSDTPYNVDEPRSEMPSELCQLQKGKHSRIHDVKCLG